MKTRIFKLMGICCLAFSCTPNQSPELLDCNAPNTNVFFNIPGISQAEGYGIIGYEGSGPNMRRYLGVIRNCNPANQTDTLIRIHIPYLISDTPFTCQLVNYVDATINDGFCSTYNYSYAYGEFTIESITADSLASGHFEFVGKYPTTQTDHFYNYNTNSIETFSADSLYIQNGTFTNVKIY